MKLLKVTCLLGKTDVFYNIKEESDLKRVREIESIHQITEKMLQYL